MGAHFRFAQRSMRIGSMMLISFGMLLFMVSPALSFQFENGDLIGSIDTTLSYGLSWRVDDPDPDLIGVVEGGNAYSVNYNDGNQNYDTGIISNVAKLTSEMDLGYRNFGLFVRGTAFYDFENEDGDRERTELRDEALDLVGSDVELLDAYVTADFDLGDVPLQIRVGDQVVSWGESTFIQNSINTINPVNVNAIRLPGAELKEALVPEGMIWASAGLTENISFEALYLYDWEETVIDPPGSYWSTNDFVGEGGDKVMLGWGGVSDMGNASAEDTFLAVSRAPNLYADDDGQYGLAMRVYAPGLNDTEFGFYFVNYHSRLPLISSWTGDATGLVAADNIATAVAPSIVGTYLTSLAIDPTNPATLNDLVTAGVTQGATVSQAGAIAQTVLGLAAAVPPAAITDVLTNSDNPLNATLVDAVTASATDAFGKTANYQVEYPEDIKLFGVSFNTLLQDSGIALQGEYSYRKDTPLQLDDIELLLATLEPLTIAKVLGPTGSNPLDPSYSQFDTVTPADIIANAGQSVYIQGYELFDVSQAQMTATKLFGPTIGANQFVMLGEVGVTHVHGMPSKSEMRLDGPGTPVSGNENHSLDKAIYPLAAHEGIEAEPADAYADATSWGYRLVAKLDFDNVIGAVTLSPRVAWQHDVSGTTPGPGGNFIDGRKAITIGVGANYLNSWSADLSYTDFFGAGRYNLINDRDLIAANIKYSF